MECAYCFLLSSSWLIVVMYLFVVSGCSCGPSCWRRCLAELRILVPGSFLRLHSRSISPKEVQQWLTFIDIMYCIYYVSLKLHYIYMIIDYFPTKTSVYGGFSSQLNVWLAPFQKIPATEDIISRFGGIIMGSHGTFKVCWCGSDLPGLGCWKCVGSRRRVKKHVLFIILKIVKNSNDNDNNNNNIIYI